MAIRRPTIGLIGADEAHRNSIRTMLASQADVLVLDEALLGVPRSRIDLLLAVLTEPWETSVSNLGRYRESLPGIPVIVLADHIGVDDAVELVKCTVTDLLSKPTAGDVLWKKIERALSGHTEPVLDSPLVTLLTSRDTGRARGPDENRRASYRAAFSAHYRPFVHIVRTDAYIPMLLEDLSLSTDRKPGGLQLSGDTVTERRLASVPFAIGDSHRARIEFPGETRLVVVQLDVRRVIRFPSFAGGYILQVGCVYSLLDSSDARVVQRYWIEAQRRNIAVRKGSA